VNSTWLAGDWRTAASLQLLHFCHQQDVQLTKSIALCKVICVRAVQSLYNSRHTVAIPHLCSCMTNVTGTRFCCILKVSDVHAE
jgi:hypothetical protein